MLRSRLLLLTVCSALLFIVALADNQGPSEVWEERDTAALAKQLLSGQQQDGSFHNNLKLTHFSVWSLQAVGVAVPEKHKTCQYAKKALSSAVDIASIYYGISVVESLGCGEALAPQIAEHINKALEGESVEDIYYAAEAVAALKSNKHLPSSIDDGSLVDAAKKVSELVEDVEDAYLVGLAWQAVGALSQIVDLGDVEEVTKLVGNVADFVEENQEEDDNGEYVEFKGGNEATPLHATSAVLRGLSALFAKFKSSVKVPGETIAKLAEFFAQRKYVGDPEDAYYTLQGLDAVSARHGSVVPLAVILDQAAVLASAKGNEGVIRVNVTDVLGRFASKARVFLVKATPFDDDTTVVLSNQELTPASQAADNIQYHLNFLAAKPEAGFYTLLLSATPLGDGAARFVGVDGAERIIKVLVAVTVGDCEVVVSDSRDAEDTLAEVKRYGCPVSQGASADFLQHLHIGFTVKSQPTGKFHRAQQAFVRFTHLASGEEVFFIARAKDKRYRLHLDLHALHEDQFDSLSGEYHVAIIVGDAFVQNPVEQSLGVISLKFPNDKQQPTAKALPDFRHPVNSTTLPPINHLFRAPETRPTWFLSSLFSFLVVSLPVSVLVFGWVLVGANIRNFPLGGTAFLDAVLFLSGLGGILALLLLFWVKLNMFQTLGYLAILGAFTFFFGLRALRYHSATYTAAKVKTT